MKNNNLLNNIFYSAIFHSITFAVTMVLIPFMARGVPDIIWIGMRIAAAVGIAALFAVKFPSVHSVLYFFMSVVQDILGFVFRLPLSHLYGISDTPLGEFEYIGQVFVWITVIVILQMVVIAITKYIYQKNK